MSYSKFNEQLQCQGLLIQYRSVRTGNYTDLALKSADGKLIKKVHKCVVCPQSVVWTKIVEKAPKKAEIVTKYQPAILSATVNWCYTGRYSFSSVFESQWTFSAMTDGKREVEFHFRVFQAATELGIEELKIQAVRNLKARLVHEPDSNDVAFWLQKTSGRKDAEPPMAIIDAIIEMQARNVKYNMDVKGLGMNEAFHKASGPVQSPYLIDFIQATGEVLGVRLHNYLRCPHCACIIRSKNSAANRVMCTRKDCEAENRLGELVVKED